jgi:hypothetical protein
LDDRHASPGPDTRSLKYTKIITCGMRDFKVQKHKHFIKNFTSLKMRVACEVNAPLSKFMNFVLTGFTCELKLISEPKAFNASIPSLIGIHLASFPALPSHLSQFPNWSFFFIGHSSHEQHDRFAK